MFKSTRSVQVVGLNKFNRDTERLVLDTALGLFREQGYDRTTMRAIATAAGISTGNAYYYFPSKQHLVQHFYVELQDEHRRASQPVLAGTTSLTRRLSGVMHAGIDAMSPYHAFASSFIKVAIQPGSPLSPFSPESAPTLVARHPPRGFLWRAAPGPERRPPTRSASCSAGAVRGS